MHLNSIYANLVIYMSRKDSKVYEIAFHVLPTVKDREIDSVVSNIEKLITSNNGSILNNSGTENVELAYTIKSRTKNSDGIYDRFNNAYFGCIKFESNSSSVDEINKALNTDSNILRFLLIESFTEETRADDSLKETEKKDKKESTKKSKNNADTNGEIISSEEDRKEITSV